MVYGNYGTVGNGRVYTAVAGGGRERGEDGGGKVRATTLDVAAPTADRSPIDPSSPRRAAPLRSESYFRNLPAPEVLGARIVPGTAAPVYQDKGRRYSLSK